MRISIKKTKVSIKRIFLLLFVYFFVLLLGPLTGYLLVKLDGEKKAMCCSYFSKTTIRTCQQELKEYGSFQDGVFAKSQCEAYQKINFCKNVQVITGDGMTCGVHYVFGYIFYSSIASFFLAPIVLLATVSISNKFSKRKKK